MPLDVVCLCRARPLGTRQNKPFAVCRPFRTRQNKRNRSHLPPHQSKALKWTSPIGLKVLSGSSLSLFLLKPPAGLTPLISLILSLSGRWRRPTAAGGREAGPGYVCRQRSHARDRASWGRVRGAAGRAVEPRGATVSARSWSRVRRRRARGGGTRRPPTPPAG